jgi:hypothetical protein
VELFVNMGFKSSKTITLQLNSHDTIGYVKAVIQQREQILTRHQRLLFNDNDLENDSTLSENGIESGSRLWLLLRLTGGAKAVKKDKDKKDKEILLGVRQAELLAAIEQSKRHASSEIGKEN